MKATLWFNKFRTGPGRDRSIYSWLALAGILLLGFLVFYNTLSNDFIYNWDDNINVTNNPHIRDFSLHGIKNLFDLGNRIDEPRLTLLTFAAEYHFYSLNPGQYHLHNVLLHLLNIILVFLFASKILNRKSPALLVALLFAVHPIHVEPVAWITGRKDLLFTFFYLLSLLTYIIYISRKENPLYLTLAFCFGFLSILSKIQALSLPVAWVALDVYFRRKFSPMMLAEKLFLMALLFYFNFRTGQLILFAAVIVIIKYHAQILSLPVIKKAGDIIYGKGRKFLPWLWGILQLQLFTLIIRKIFRNSTIAIGINDSILPFLSVFLYLFSYYRQLRQKGRIHIRFNILKYPKTILFTAAVLLILFAVLLFPHLKFWPAEFNFTFTPVDRFFMACYSLCYYLLALVYPFNASPIQPYPSPIHGLPWIYYAAGGWVIMATLVIALLVWKKKLSFSRQSIFGMAFFLINIGLLLHIISIEGRVIVADRYGYLAYAGLFIGLVFYLDQWIRKAPGMIKKMIVTGFALFIIVFAVYSNTRNRTWANGLDLFTEVISHHPDYEMAYSNRGTLYLNKGPDYYPKAIIDFNKALQLKTGYDVPHYNLALLYMNLHQYDSAYNHCNKTLKINPGFADARYLRGFIKNQKGDYAGALEDYNEVLKVKPGHTFALYNRGNTRKNTGDLRGALNDYRQTIKTDSNFAEAYNAMGVTYFLLEDYNGSLPCYSSAINKALDPAKKGNYYFNRALSEIKLLRSTDACSDLMTSVSLGYQEAKSAWDQHCR